MAFLKPGPNNNGLRGRMGGQVYSGGGEDTIVREWVDPVQPNSPAQLAQRGRIRRGTQGWGTLTDTQRAAWAATVTAFGIKAKGTRRQKPKAMTPYNYYTSLASKFLACTPGGTVPVNPPSTKFAGDTLTFSVTQTTGNIVVAAVGSNKAGVKTEIMVQKLAAAYRKPVAGGYRAKTYVAFSASTPSINVPVAPGVYSVAVQYVNTATGETSGFQVLGTALVSLALEDGGADEAPAASKRKAA